MSRRSDPERIEAARHQATRNRLTGVGMTEETADAWIEAWPPQASRDGVEPGAGYWDAAYGWISAERQHRVRP
jgi:hypothetical protein